MLISQHRGRGTSNILLSGSGILLGAEIYDAELHGAMSRLGAVLSSGKDHECTDKLVTLNNTTAVKALHSGTTTSSV